MRGLEWMLTEMHCQLDWETEMHLHWIKMEWATETCCPMHSMLMTLNETMRCLHCWWVKQRVKTRVAVRC